MHNEETRVAVTVGEWLWLQRRRKGRTQARQARLNTVSRVFYARMEHDQTPARNKVKVSEAEWFMLQRRRAGMTQAQVAAELDCCVYWLRLMERGEVDPTPLRGYWQ